MDTTYIPEASIYEHRDLMFEWEEAVKYGTISGLVTAVSAFLIGYLCSDFGDWYEFPLYGVMLALLVGSNFARKWKYPAYWVNVVAFLGYIILWLIGFREMGRDALIVACVGLASGCLTSFFNLKCIRNFYPVFKELEKCKGFPSFIANTADLYGEKLYLKDEETADDKYKASHNPFNSKEEIEKEEFARSQNLKSNAKLEKVINALNQGFNGQTFNDIAQYLLTGSPIADPYMCLADFGAFCDIHAKADKVYKDKMLWAKKSLNNIATAGIFASDRSIREYADRIWGLKRI
jgi:hypothetical protein